jgi:intracellular sulfur oxidation DsrE/DsrF family protein
MHPGRLQSSIERRSFLSRLGAGVGILVASLAGYPAKAAGLPGKPSSPSGRHAQDDWFDEIPGQHRMVFDTTMPEGIGLALQFAKNYFAANQDAYGLHDSDLAVVIVMRHRSTAFAFNDAMWTKYGKQLSEHAFFSDPKINEPIRNRLDLLFERAFTHANRQNVFTASGDGPEAAGPTASLMAGLIRKGVQFGVCGTSTRNICENIARATGGNADAILNEITANLIPSAHMVPAGIVALNRAQERGYSYIFTA